MKTSLKSAFTFAVNAGFCTGCGAVAGAVSYALVSACTALSVTPLSLVFCAFAALCAIDATAAFFLDEIQDNRQKMVM